MSNRKLTIGLFGFGVVGEGLYKVLQQTPSLNASIKKVCIKDIHKQRNVPSELFTSSKEELLNDEEINVIVEVTNDADAAFEITKTALVKGKSVVSANKKMIAEHLKGLLELQQQTGQSLLYEAAACASIPVIRNLEEYYDNDLLHSVTGIVNGSSNFILSKIFKEGLEYKEALSLAQQLGFAETNPKLDVEGYDAVNKWTFLLTHSFGIIPSANDIVFTGIQNIHAADAILAIQKGQQVKLVAQAKKLSNGKVAAFVLPQFVNNDQPLAFVENEYNGVLIESHFADRQFFYGKGAGSFPTASAVLSDIAALRYNYKYEYKKLYRHQPHELTDDFYIKVYVSANEWKDIPTKQFEQVEEWHSATALRGAGEGRKYIKGLLHFSVLKENTWWKENDVSLILQPDAVIESIEVMVRKKMEKCIHFV
jgi:homoserine dehydrogenase